jgi:hypothetical protein
MHLLYVDDSGSVSNPNEKYFVLAGVAVFERRLYHLITAIDAVVDGFKMSGDPHEVELHGSPMYAGREAWRSAKRSDREAKIQQALATLLHPQTTLKLFAVAVDKAAVSPRDPIELAFEEISNRFNLFLQRINDRHPKGDAQKGLIIMDESHHEGALQALARHFRINGGRWGHFRNLAEVPLFVDSRASRVIQVADLVAWGTWRQYEHRDGRFFDRLIPKFDAEGGVIHGLVHLRGRATDNCYCPACTSRNIRDARTYPRLAAAMGRNDTSK